MYTSQQAPPLSSKPGVSTVPYRLCPCTVSIDDKGSIAVQCHIASTEEKPEVPPLRSFCPCTPRTKQRMFGDPTMGPCHQRWLTVGKNAFFSWYFWACIVYVIYASQVLAIDYCPYGEDNILCSFTGDTSINQQYIAAGAVHVTNAVQYFISWNRDFGYPMTNLVIIPEVLNIIEASLYLSTATKYANASTECERLTNEALANCSITDDDTSSCTVDVCNEIYHPLHRTELAASIIELLASIGWIWSWYQTYIRTPGRGWTLDDPDLFGSFFTFIPSIIYLVYYIQINMDPSQYGTNYLYVTGDILYMVGALGYLLGAWRDAGGSTCMPLAGGYEYELVEYGKKMDHFLSENNKGSLTVDSIPYGMGTGTGLMNGHSSYPSVDYPNQHPLQKFSANPYNTSTMALMNGTNNGTSKHSAIRDIVISPTPPRMMTNVQNFHSNPHTVNNPVFLNSNTSTPSGMGYRNRLQPPDNTIM